MKPLTPEILEERRQKVLRMLEANPKLTKGFFHKNHSFDNVWLRKLEQEGVKFGKHKPKPFSYVLKKV